MAGVDKFNTISPAIVWPEMAGDIAGGGVNKTVDFGWSFW